MKLRCTSNSIRIRLRKSEIQQLDQENRVVESVSFPIGERLIFSLSIGSDTLQIQASFNQNTIEIILPQEEANQWISTNQVGIEYYLPLADENQLHILIEKDFPCIDRANEDKSDTFWELASDTSKVC